MLAGTGLIVSGSGIALLATTKTAGLILLGTGLITGLAIGVLSYPCNYTLTATDLHIRCGMFEEEIPLTEVVKAEAVTSWLAAPALSVRRVRITLRHGSRLISPRDRTAFIADLTAHIAPPSATR